MESHRVNSIISGRSPPSHCTLTLIAIQGHQDKTRNNTRTEYFWTKSFSLRCSNMVKKVKTEVWFCYFDEGRLQVIGV